MSDTKKYPTFKRNSHGDYESNDEVNGARFFIEKYSSKEWRLFDGSAREEDYNRPFVLDGRIRVAICETLADAKDCADAIVRRETIEEAKAQERRKLEEDEDYIYPNLSEEAYESLVELYTNPAVKSFVNYLGQFDDIILRRSIGSFATSETYRHWKIEASVLTVMDMRVRYFEFFTGLYHGGANRKYVEMVTCLAESITNIDQAIATSTEELSKALDKVRWWRYYGRHLATCQAARELYADILSCILDDPINPMEAFNGYRDHIRNQLETSCAYDAEITEERATHNRAKAKFLIDMRTAIRGYTNEF